MKILKFIINIVLVSLVCICAYKIVDTNEKYKKVDDIYEVIKTEKEDIEKEDFQITHKNYRGWIKINNTNIDYPVLQAKDNKYYLDKDMNGKYLIAGSIFMNYTNNGFVDQNTILFGHNMKNGTMFADLTKYMKQDFFYGNNNIDIEISNGQHLEYEVFSVYVTDAKDNYIISKFKSINEYKKTLHKIKKKSMYPLDIELNEEDKIITLSTCYYAVNDGRLVVHGKLKK